MRLPVVPARGEPCRSSGCTACCHDTEMLLSEADIARLTASGADPEGWLTASDGYVQLRVRDAPALPGMQGRPCWFLRSDGACGVYEARPEGCRLYPAVYDGAVALDDEECPHTDAFDLDRSTDQAVRRLVVRLVEERGVRRPGAGSKPS